MNRLQDVPAFSEKFPLDMNGTVHITVVEGKAKNSIKLTLTATFGDFNTVKEIKIPAGVIKKAISMEDYMIANEAQVKVAEEATPKNNDD